MQVQPIQTSTATSTPTTNTNFKQLKEIKVRGKNFKEYPEYATKILKTVKDVIKNDKEVSKFFDRFDSSMLLRSYTNSDSHVIKTTSVNIYYRNQNKNLLKRITSLFFRIPKVKSIRVSGFGICNWEKSVDYLIQGIKEGRLSQEARVVNEEFDKKIAKKAEKVFVRQQKVEAKTRRELEVNKEKENLDDLIKEMTIKKEV